MGTAADGRSTVARRPPAGGDPGPTPAHLLLPLSGPPPPPLPAPQPRVPGARSREGARTAVQRAERCAGMDADYPAFEPPLCSELKHLCRRLQEAYRELREDLTPCKDDRYYR